MIKVLHIIKSLGRGGAETLLPETLAFHNKQEFEFHYIYFLPWKNQMVSAIEENGGVVTCMPAKNNLKIMLSVNKIASYIKTHGIQIIHCHLPWAGIVGRLAGKMTGVPVVYTEHNKWERYHKLTFTLNKMTFPLQEMVIPVSGDVESSIRQHYKKPSPELRTILNGVNTEKFIRPIEIEPDIRKQLNIPATTRVIGTISVFRVQKRLKTWLEIAHKIHEKFPDTFFILVGDGLLRDEIHAKAKELGMDSYVHFAGLQEEVRPYFKCMDVFMMASEFEGLPIALLESMSMECIPCCTAAGGIPEVIADGHSGLLADVNEPMLLVDKLGFLLENWDAQASGLSRNARLKVQKEFSLQRMVGEIEDAYRYILKKQGGK